MRKTSELGMVCVCVCVCVCAGCPFVCAYTHTSMNGASVDPELADLLVLVCVCDGNGPMVAWLCIGTA
uniref:Secreted protein n=1 Tax=Arundo donax TaxID=35708 RepID=A0A0A8XTD2_ARUDO